MTPVHMHVMHAPACVALLCLAFTVHFLADMSLVSDEMRFGFLARAKIASPRPHVSRAKRAREVENSASIA